MSFSYQKKYEKLVKYPQKRVPDLFKPKTPFRNYGLILNPETALVNIYFIKKKFLYCFLNP